MARSAEIICKASASASAAATGGSGRGVAVRVGDGVAVATTADAELLTTTVGVSEGGALENEHADSNSAIAPEIARLTTCRARTRLRARGAGRALGRSA